MSVETSQLTRADVGERQQYGAWTKRLVGFLIDEALVSPFFVAGYVFCVLGLSGHGRPGYLFASISAIAYGLAMGFYNRCVRMGLTGQSWGKAATGTRLVSERTGEPIGVGNAIIRDMSHTIDLVVFGMGFLMPLWDGKRQTISDKLVRTLVVDSDESRSRSIPPLA